MIVDRYLKKLKEGVVLEVRYVKIHVEKEDSVHKTTQLFAYIENDMMRFDIAFLNIFYCRRILPPE